MVFKQIKNKILQESNRRWVNQAKFEIQTAGTFYCSKNVVVFGIYSILFPDKMSKEKLEDTKNKDKLKKKEGEDDSEKKKSGAKKEKKNKDKKRKVSYGFVSRLKYTHFFPCKNHFLLLFHSAVTNQLLDSR